MSGEEGRWCEGVSVVVREVVSEEEGCGGKE